MRWDKIITSAAGAVPAACEFCSSASAASGVPALMSARICGVMARAASEDGVGSGKFGVFIAAASVTDTERRGNIGGHRDGDGLVVVGAYFLGRNGATARR